MALILTLSDPPEFGLSPKGNEQNVFDRTIVSSPPKIPFISM
jgi:hypothetical protein